MIETFAVENDFVQATTDSTLIRYYLLIVAKMCYWVLSTTRSMLILTTHYTITVRTIFNIFFHSGKGIPYSDED